jgi:predicted dehydrogenase
MRADALRWGILGCGGAAAKFARDLAAQGMRPRAAAARDGARAAAFAAAHGIPTSYGSYGELIDDPHLDAIYVATANHAHAEWSVRASRAGKAVLCEKPASLDAAECEAMIRAAGRSGAFFMEGFMYALHPQWGLARALIDSDAIGQVRSLYAAFCYDLGHRPGNIRLDPAALGGALSDVGCYCLHFARRFAGAEPVSMRAAARMGPEGVDEVAEAFLEFPGGVTASFACALREARPHAAVIEGERGRIEIPRPWHPPPDGAEVRLSNEGGESVFKAGDGLGLFAREARHVEEFLAMGQSPVLTWEDCLAQARAMERLRSCAGPG